MTKTDDTLIIFALSRVPRIPPNDPGNFRPGPNRAWEKMTWRVQSQPRIEDVAYSLTGILDITMTIAYGERSTVQKIHGRTRVKLQGMANFCGPADFLVLH